MVADIWMLGYSNADHNFITIIIIITISSGSSSGSIPPHSSPHLLCDPRLVQGCSNAAVVVQHRAAHLAGSNRVWWLWWLWC